MNGHFSRLKLALLPLVAFALVYACAGTRYFRDDSSGSKLYYSRCRSCHAPVDPSSASAEIWTEYLDRYGERAGLSQNERDSVMAFVMRASQNAAEQGKGL